MRYAMIMAGGSGTRLWPMSRKERPKQLIPLVTAEGEEGGRARSLLELAAQRLEGLVPPERRYICTAQAYREVIKATVPEFSDDRILGEPAARDTVNAVGFAAAVFAKIDPEAVFVVLTADQVIEPVEVLRERVDLGFRLVEADANRLVTFSIKPTYAATGYGYVERGSAIHLPEPEAPKGRGRGAKAEAAQPSPSAGLAFRVARFVEKPSAERAQAYVESGQFSWNSGMFVFKAATFMECLRRYKPESHAGLTRIAEAWGTPEQERVLAEVYPALPKISVDYAVMEPASREASLGLASGPDSVSVCTVLMDVKWLDVGSWPSYGETLKPDEAGNRFGGEAGRASVVVEGEGNLIVSDDPSHTVTVLGAEDLIVVHTKDATLVMPRSRAEDLKKLHGRLPEGLQ